MKFGIYFLFAAILIFFLFPANLTAGADLLITPASGMEFSDILQTKYDFERFPDIFFSKNDEIIPSGFALVNPLGYPNGKSTINRFPHFEIGIAAGGGVLEYDRKDDYTDNNPTVPSGGVNSGFHMGTGVTDSIDITLKGFFFSFKWIASLDQELTGEGDTTTYTISIDESNITSLGLKVRFNWIERRLYIPTVYTFGGVSLNLGVDYMRANIKSSATLTDVQTVNLSIGSGLVMSNISGDGSMYGNLVSITPEALIYVDLITFFSLYTGPSASFNFGYVDFNIDANGSLISLEQSIGGVALGDVNIATVNFRSRHHMIPKLIIPKWTVGLEFNIMSFKLQVEGSAVLTGITDSLTAQAGVRVQI